MDESPIPFAPVPTRARHDGWTPARQRAFIANLAQLGLVGAAARAVGMSAKSAYALRRHGDAASFAQAWDEAVALGHAAARSHALDHALTGEVTPIFYRGRQVGERRRYNTRLVIAALTAMTPPRPAADRPPSHDWLDRATRERDFP